MRSKAERSIYIGFLTAARDESKIAQNIRVLQYKRRHSKTDSLCIGFTATCN
jgi:hypothetical protein